MSTRVLSARVDGLSLAACLAANSMVRASVYTYFRTSRLPSTPPTQEVRRTPHSTHVPHAKHASHARPLSTHTGTEVICSSGTFAADYCSAKKIGTPPYSMTRKTPHWHNLRTAVCVTLHPPAPIYPPSWKRSLEGLRALRKLMF